MTPEATTQSTGESTTVRLRAMATDVTLTLVAPAELATPVLEQGAAVFARVEAACTRFDPTSPLMVANASGRQWYVLPPEGFEAVVAAWNAYQQTGGLFDPRVLEHLTRIGYDRTLGFADGPVSVRTPAASGGARPTAADARAVAPPRWCPELDVQRQAVRIGEHPLDLGGIGKGLAVRRAAAVLAELGAPFLVDAGGDLAVGGDGPEGQGWLVGVEDPLAGADREPDLLAVLRLADRSCATSSVRVRHWQVDGRPVHHLIDPRTGQSCATGLRAVTVVDTDAATAEVWSKALFVLGRTDIESACHDRGLAALWVADDGSLGMSDAIRAHIDWQAHHAA